LSKCSLKGVKIFKTLLVVFKAKLCKILRYKVFEFGEGWEGGGKGKRRDSE
jgi:hypothetical protein